MGPTQDGAWAEAQKGSTTGFQSRSETDAQMPDAKEAPSETQKQSKTAKHTRSETESESGIDADCERVVVGVAEAVDERAALAE